ncbi:MAG: L-2-amino-thiazoline-4-carboxylic acid hydrolase [Lachnospiraceae bacterium]|nr:L-2-amino-thiazoline-4-carboxylic acid hydrolase [Lachnospiraceae bacterium]
MGKIQNIPQITDDPQLNIRRSDIEQRAEWFYFQNDEAAKRGLDWEEWCRPAIRRVGHLRGEESLNAAVTDRSDLQQVLAMFRNNVLGTRTFEKEYVKDTPDEIIIDHHYCPLVAGWQKCTDDEELIAKCCDIAMEGDRGIFDLVEGADFFLDSTIAEGAPVCRLRLKKREK